MLVLRIDPGHRESQRVADVRLEVLGECQRDADDYPQADLDRWPHQLSSQSRREQYGSGLIQAANPRLDVCQLREVGRTTLGQLGRDRLGNGQDLFAVWPGEVYHQDRLSVVGDDGRLDCAGRDVVACFG